MRHPTHAIDAGGWPLLLADSSDRQTKTASGLDGVRRRDLVRELAREFEDLSPQDVGERVALMPWTVNDSARLAIEVRAQVIDDLVDLLDQGHRGRLRSRRTVRVQAPRGYTRRVLGGLTVGESADVAARLRARGWTEDDVKRTMPSRRSST